MYGRNVHPAMMGWWRAKQREGQCGSEARVEGGGGGGGGYWAGGGGHDHEGGNFGVRRPLRFLAWKLELSESQMAALAKILDELKTERAQAAVDDRRVTAAFADAIAGDVFDEAKVKEAAAWRVKSAERLRDAVASALAKIHALLEPEQRQHLAYLIRTGTLTI